MKLSTAVFALATFASSVSAMQPIRATANLMKQARRLEDANNQEDEEQDEYAFLGGYHLKMLGCKAGEKYVNPENGEYESSSIIFRLCPSSGECDSTSSGGCNSGYGDFVVGINSFVQEYLEDKREDMQQDDNFKVEEFGECREYDADQDADEDGEEVQYFLGPACTEDGKGIRLQLFLDEYCSTTSEDISFEDISNGVALPYEDGGLVSTYCESCAGYNDNGEYEVSEMCMILYENAGKCETKMEEVHYAGRQEGSCEFIESLMPAKKSGGAGKAVGWLFFVLVVVGVAFVGYTMMKKKNMKEPLMDG